MKKHLLLLLTAISLTTFITGCTKKENDKKKDGQEIIEIHDPSFKASLVNTFDVDGDNEISKDEALVATAIHIPPTNVKSLAGIEYFLNLKSLTCSNNQLTSLDISKNTQLKWLSCSENQLTSLDVSENTALIELLCSDNQLTTLDVSKNTLLEGLDCYSNQLTTLDLSKNIGLKIIGCIKNQLTTLDVSKNTVLVYLYCTSNPNLETITVKSKQNISITKDEKTKIVEVD